MCVQCLFVNVFIRVKVEFDFFIQAVISQILWTLISDVLYYSSCFLDICLARTHTAWKIKSLIFICKFKWVLYTKNRQMRILLRDRLIYSCMFDLCTNVYRPVGKWFSQQWNNIYQVTTKYAWFFYTKSWWTELDLITFECIYWTKI